MVTAILPPPPPLTPRRKLANALRRLACDVEAGLLPDHDLTFLAATVKVISDPCPPRTYGHDVPTFEHEGE